MSSGPTQQRTIPDAAVLGTQPVPRWSRPLAVATAAIFCVSTVFPVVAGLSKNTGAFPKWWGIADVVLAFVLAAMVFLVMVRSEERRVGKECRCRRSPAPSKHSGERRDRRHAR